MKRKLFFLTILISFFGCQKEPIPESPSSTVRGLKTVEISEAQILFQETIKKSKSSKISESDFFTPHWEHAHYEDLNNTEEKMLVIPATNEFKKLGFSRILMWKKDGRTIVRAFTMFPDGQKISKIFNGRMIVTDLDLNFVIGYRAKNGLIVAKLLKGKKNLKCSDYDGGDWDCGELDEVVIESSPTTNTNEMDDGSDSSGGGTYYPEGEEPDPETTWPPGGGGGTTDGETDPEPDCTTTAENVQAIFPEASPEVIDFVVQMLNDLGQDFGIDTVEEVQHFLAQAGYESGGFKDLNIPENLSYSATRLVEVWPTRFSFTDSSKLNPYNYANNPEALANVVYCCRMGNGNEASGDGWKYRGRGIFQLTGKNNYSAYYQFLSNNGIEWTYDGPDSLGSQTHSVLSAMWYFMENVLDKITITSTTSSDAVTNEINRWTDQSSKDGREALLNEAKTNINNCL